MQPSRFNCRLHAACSLLHKQRLSRQVGAWTLAFWLLCKCTVLLIGLLNKLLLAYFDWLTSTVPQLRL